MVHYLKDYIYHDNIPFALAYAVNNLNDGDTLCLGDRVYEIDNSFAMPEIFYLPRYSDDKKYYAINIKDKKNITIDGQGATLLFDGNVSAFGLENCENVIIKNLTIDYKTPCFIQGKITDATDKYMEVDFSKDGYDVTFDDDKKMIFFKSPIGKEYLSADSFLLNEFEMEPKRPSPSSPDYFLCLNNSHPVYASMSVCVDTEIIDNGKMRFSYKGKSVKHNVGNYIVGSIHERRNNNIHLFRCKNVTLENITMYSSLSFGVISLCGENLTVRNVNSVVNSDTNRLLAVVADMFHCVNTKGYVNISDCRIENLMDDCINIHSLLSQVKSILDRNTLIVDFPYLAKKAVNLYTKGEKVNVLHPETFETVTQLTVSTSEYMGDYHLVISFDEDVADVYEGYILESFDAKPTVHISGCSAGNNRGRGFLVPCGRETIVENNMLYSSKQGIAVNGASKLYLEGSAVTDLTIRNNDFTKCSYMNKGYVININPVSLSETKTPYHENISIYDNDFNDSANKLIYMRSAEDVEIYSNNISKETAINDNLFVFEDCKNVTVK